MSENTVHVSMHSGDLLNDLTYRNAAYNILYRLGFESTTVPNFTPGQAEWWLDRCAEVLHGTGTTALHLLLKEKVPLYQLNHAAELLDRCRKPA
jgi:hypothetical protein